MIEYTVKVWANGTKKEWYLNGRCHREGGLPAVEWADGSKLWYLNDKRHREDGPAYEGADGSKEWYLNDKLHREDGPAVERPDGSKEWWLNGKRVTEEDVMGPKAEELTVAEISRRLGYAIKIVK